MYFWLFLWLYSSGCPRRTHFRSQCKWGLQHIAIEQTQFAPLVDSDWHSWANCSRVIRVPTQHGNGYAALWCWCEPRNAPDLVVEITHTLTDTKHCMSQDYITRFAYTCSFECMLQKGIYGTRTGIRDASICRDCVEWFGSIYDGQVLSA